jgi:hypothetical protein
MKQRVYLTPGIGNQIYQYRYALSLRDKGYEVDLIAVSKYINNHQFVFTKLFDEKINYIHFSVMYFIWQYCHFFSTKIILLFQQKKLSNAPFSNIRLFHLHLGYWQSDINIKDDELVVQKSLILPHVKKVRNVVGVHVRLGDYATSIHADHFDFLIAALKRINNKDMKILKIVTNDANHIRIQEMVGNVGLEFNKVKIYSNSAIEDLLTLSETNELILSNSTYSLYAASLARKANKAKCIIPPYMYKDKSGDINCD